MNEHLISNLEKLKDEVFHYNFNDSLIDLNANSIELLDFALENAAIEFDFSSKIKKIYQEAENFRKESGLSTLMISHGYLKWQYKDKEILTPIFLISTTYKLNRISNNLEVNFDSDQISLNPFLLQVFRNELDLNIEEENLINLIAFKNYLSRCNFKFEIFQDNFISNFHIHRYQIIRELDGLLNQSTFSLPLQKIFGSIDENQCLTLNLPEMNLFSLDIDQIQTLKALEERDVVVQGPPGTGKSQVIINLIGKAIYENKKVLLVSEKRAALDVIEKKLIDCKLDFLGFVYTENSSNTDFIKKLKQSWNKFESVQISKSSKIYLTKQRKDLLNNELNRLFSGNLIGGLNYNDLTKVYSIDQIKTFKYFSVQVQLIDFERYRELIKCVYDQGLHKIVSVLNQNYVNDSSSFEVLQKIESFNHLTNELKSIFNIEKIDDFTGLKKKLVLCQLIQNETKKSYFNLINPTSKDSKKYHNLRKKYFTIKNKFLKYNPLELELIKLFSYNELLDFKTKLENASYFIKRNLKRKLSQILKIEKADIENRLSYYIDLKLIDLEFEKLNLELKSIGIHSPEIDFIEIDTSIRMINQYEWEEYFNLKDRETILSLHDKIDKWSTLSKIIFNDYSDYLLNDFKDEIQFKKEDFIKHFDKIKLIPNLVLKSLKLTDNFVDFEKIVLKSNLVDFENQFPELSKFKIEDLANKIKFIQEEEIKEQSIFSDDIIENLAKKFNQYHELLLTNTAKLNSEEKILKTTLKIGKSILVKEFNKKRSHLTPREMYQSEARIWIDLLMPLFMCNPLVLSKIFPIEKDLFDFVIFDEAGQIPFYNGLGAIQRGKRVLIAGDDQQLSPNFYFKSGNKEIISLLDTANYFYEKKMLKHHYRSVKSDLIAFSNRYFYKNELKVFPKFEKNTQLAIKWHYCQNGIYAQNQNEVEALKVIEILFKELDKGLSIGIVAFSKTQLDCILNNIPTSKRLQIDQLITDNLLFFKSLENVQGDECDLLIISLGYGKNDQNEFRMQFGPLNHLNGAKRLNVLFSRAKERIEFISSVNSNDFKVSSNESVNLLKKYIEILENQENDFDNLELKSNILQVDLEEYMNSDNIEELLTYYSVMSKRGWELKFI